MTNYDTACTIDERFERPWQPGTVISIKNIYLCEMSYPMITKIDKFKGATKQQMFVHAVALTPHVHCTISPSENRSYLGEFEAEFKTVLVCESGLQGVLFDGKTRKSKIS
jgi:hypothetical protein